MFRTWIKKKVVSTMKCSFYLLTFDWVIYSRIEESVRKGTSNGNNNNTHTRLLNACAVWICICVFFLSLILLPESLAHIPSYSVRDSQRFCVFFYSLFIVGPPIDSWVLVSVCILAVLFQAYRHRSIVHSKHIHLDADDSFTHESI